jgi:hypothetical protein
MATGGCRMDRFRGCEVALWRRRFHRRRCGTLGRLIGGTELGNQRQPHALGKRFGLASAVSQANGEHAGAEYGLEQGVDRAVVGQVEQVTQVEHHRSTGKQLWGRLHAPLQFAAKCCRVHPADAHTGNAHLTEAQVAGVGGIHFRTHGCCSPVR